MSSAHHAALESRLERIQALLRQLGFLHDLVVPGTAICFASLDARVDGRRAAASWFGRRTRWAAGASGGQHEEEQGRQRVSDRNVHAHLQ
jgi:hypothetical protein